MKKFLFTLFSILLISGAVAQETTAVVRGNVSDADGSAVANAEVVVTSRSTGLTKNVRTDSDGNYYVSGLPAGVRYDVVVSAAGLEGAVSNGLSIAVGQTRVLNYVLNTFEEVRVVGERIELADTAIGPNAVFSLDDIQNSPSINRNILEVVQQDPRLYLDQSGGNSSGDSFQCNGANPRYNSLTVDGVRLNDGFGLNRNGYPTQRMPFPYDAISSVAVELAPMSVTYGGFSACNINAVTKSGQNELFASGFVEFGGDTFRGDSLEGDDIAKQAYDEAKYGFEVGAALIPDSLFAYFAYEKYDGADLNNRGAIGTGAVNEVAVTQAELNEIASIARDVYGFDPGTSTANPFDFEDEKYLAKIDWYASDVHRLSFTYMYNDSANKVGSDRDLDEFEFSKHFYDRGAELTSTNVSIYSDWTEKFSTEVRLSYSEVDFLQQCVAGAEFGEMRIELDSVDVYLGCDDSRQANDLDWTVDQTVIKGTLVEGNHTITAGYERESLDIFNLFYQHVDTEIRFDGIDNFRAGNAARIYYGNAITNNFLDSAVQWAYDVETMYLQDSIQVSPALNVTLGVRYDYYSSDDRPVLNPAFIADYGFANDANLDGLDLLMPRFGFTFEASDALTLRGGVGIFSGGNPNVWYSNVYSNTNMTAVQTQIRGVNLFDLEYVGCENGVPNGPGWCVPSVLYNQVLAGDGSNFELNYMDPNFKTPYERKVTLGLTYYLPNDYVLTADAIMTQGEDTAIWKRGDLEVVGTNSDGSPEYDSVREASFVLTNSAIGNESESISFGLFKSFENGLDMRLGYAWNDSRDVNPMTSSIAFSNYVNRTFFDPQEEVLSRSNYNIEHRFTGVFNWTRNYFGDYSTRFSLFAQASSGVPYSLTLSGAGCTIGRYGFTPYLDFIEHCLIEPGTRNSEDGSWWRKADFRVSQQLPYNGRGFIVFDNFTNFLNEDWGILQKANFPYGVEPRDVEAGIAESRIGDASLWEIRMGVDFRF